MSEVYKTIGDAVENLNSKGSLMQLINQVGENLKSAEDSIVLIQDRVSASEVEIDKAELVLESHREALQKIKEILEKANVSTDTKEIREALITVTKIASKFVLDDI